MALPKLDLVGPSVEEDVRRLLARYDEKAIKDAIKQQTKKRPGQKAKQDWTVLRLVLQKDAETWLEGGDPFVERKNYQIAKEFAEEHPGQSYPATFRRIQAKLSKHRRYFTLVVAEEVAKCRYPHAAYFRALKILATVRSEIWQGYFDHANKCLSDFSIKFGPPSETTTMQEIESGSAQALTPNLVPGTVNMLQILMGYKRE